MMGYDSYHDNLDRLESDGETYTRPRVITLCGSTRFPDAFALANMHLSMLGHIVIGLGCFGHADFPVGARFLTSDGDEMTPEKQHLDRLHFRKIDICDGIFVVNPGGYVGSSTKREIAYARSQGKAVEWMFAEEIRMTPAQNPSAEGLIDDTPVCPFCNSARHDSERLHDGNVMQTADLVDAMLNVWLNAGEPEFPADLNRKPQFPQDYSDGAQSLFRAKMEAALGTAIRNMPYLAAIRGSADMSLEWAGEMRERIDALLTDITRPSAIKLMAGEMSAQEARTAYAVANGIAEKVRHALTMEGLR